MRHPSAEMTTGPEGPVAFAFGLRRFYACRIGHAIGAAFDHGQHARAKGWCDIERKLRAAIFQYIVQ
jgi:hypothetical protein